MQHRLTQSPTLHFLRRDRKDSEYLDHDLDNHVGHGCSRCDARVYLKPVKEMLDVVKEVNKLVSAGVDIFSRL